jgi:hypothetical protein
VWQFPVVFFLSDFRSCLISSGCWGVVSEVAASGGRSESATARFFSFLVYIWWQRHFTFKKGGAKGVENGADAFFFFFAFLG